MAKLTRPPRQSAAIDPFPALDRPTLLRFGAVSMAAGLGGTLSAKALLGDGYAVVFVTSMLWIFAFLGLSAWILKLMLLQKRLWTGMLAIAMKLGLLALMVSFLMGMSASYPDKTRLAAAMLTGISIPVFVVFGFAAFSLVHNTIARQRSRQGSEQKSAS